MTRVKSTLKTTFDKLLFYTKIAYTQRDYERRVRFTVTILMTAVYDPCKALIKLISMKALALHTDVMLNKIVKSSTAFVHIKDDRFIMYVS